MNIHNNIAYDEIDGLWKGYVRAAVQPKQVTPHLRWNGKRIPILLMHQAVAWFRAVNKSSKAECQLRLFYHVEHGWAFDALPQSGAGLSTKEISDDPRHGKIISDYAARGYESCGTIHSHCNISAFQSGTDSADEMQQASGPHFTIGKLEEKNPDWHCRIVFRRVQYEAAAEDFVDIGPNWSVPDESIVPVIARHLLLNPPDVEYPKHWDDMIVKPVAHNPWNDDDCTWSPSRALTAPAWLADRITKLTQTEAELLCDAADSFDPVKDGKFPDAIRDMAIDCAGWGVDGTEVERIWMDANARGFGYD